MDDTSPTGARLPPREAIEALNQNARVAAQRSRYASLAQQNERVGGETFRRNYTRRRVTAPLGGFEEQVPVPPDTEPPRSPTPIAQIRNLLSQFQGQGGTGSGGGGGGGGGFGGGGGGGGSPPSAPPTGGGSGSTAVTCPEGQTLNGGVCTATNPGGGTAPPPETWVATAYSNTGFPPPNIAPERLRRGSGGYWEYRAG